MFQMINWLCLISISFLVIEVMIYFCKDVLNIYSGVSSTSRTDIAKTKVKTSGYSYGNKIAK